MCFMCNIQLFDGGWRLLSYDIDVPSHRSSEEGFIGPGEANISCKIMDLRGCCWHSPLLVFHYALFLWSCEQEDLANLACFF